ncbi:MAG: hypothetical protein MZU97_06415 [Bacillus subtilis]|nr:hypothetical protein [Bacillus subtilis]
MNALNFEGQGGHPQDRHHLAPSPEAPGQAPGRAPSASFSWRRWIPSWKTT